MTSRGRVVSAISVTHVVPSLAPEEGGPSYSVPALVAALRDAGLAARTRFVTRNKADRPFKPQEACDAHPAGAVLGGVLRSSPALARALAADARSGGILHAHGLWLAPNLYPAWTKSRIGASVKLVHTPRGMLGAAALAISARKKKLVWALAQRSALAAADCLHATALSELGEIRDMGLKNPVAVIPNGIDLPDLQAIPRSSGDAPTVLSLGRVHPKKGLDRLVSAWAAIEPAFPSWRLRIVGPAELGHDRSLRALAQDLGLRRVTIEGPVYGPEKLTLVRNADLFVLSTLNENFALTVAEALALETPVISTKGAPWSGLERERCGWWIDHGVEPLTQALRQALTLAPPERAAMGQHGRAWMARDFGWDRVARDMIDVYRWLLMGGDAPATVYKS